MEAPTSHHSVKNRNFVEKAVAVTMIDSDEDYYSDEDEFDDEDNEDEDLGESGDVWSLTDSGANWGVDSSDLKASTEVARSLTASQIIQTR